MNRIRRHTTSVYRQPSPLPPLRKSDPPPDPPPGELRIRAFVCNSPPPPRLPSLECEETRGEPTSPLPPLFYLAYFCGDAKC